MSDDLYKEVLYFDIETVAGINQDKLVESLSSKIKVDGRIKDQEKMDADYQKKLNDLTSEFGLSPLTGRIICFGWAKNEEEPQALCTNDETVVLTRATELLNEIGMLDTAVTFNGKVFDMPFLRIRSAVHGIYLKPIIDYKYNQEHHFDVRYALTNFNPMGKGTLEEWCMTFGIPTGNSTIKGSDIQALFDQGEYGKIADKTKDDIRMTRELHKKIEDYFA